MDIIDQMNNIKNFMIRREKKMERLTKVLGDILNNYEKCPQNPRNNPTISYHYLEKARDVLLDVESTSKTKAT